MANTITHTYDKRAETDYTVGGRRAKNFKIVTGKFDYGTLTASGNGWILPISNLCGVFIEPTRSGIPSRYDYTNKTVAPYYGIVVGTAGALQTCLMQIASTTLVVGTCTGIHFLAWGYD